MPGLRLDLDAHWVSVRVRLRSGLGGLGVRAQVLVFLAMLQAEGQVLLGFLAPLHDQSCLCNSVALSCGGTLCALPCRVGWGWFRVCGQLTVEAPLRFGKVAVAVPIR